ncbi:MAG: hypothetical protein LBR13_01025, partial [Dysgonamonadaceae bacterium]|nr:hypothetical protein [Dysgonamonadaceae bacterium]
AVNPQVGDEGYIYVYPYETSKDDWRTLKLTVRTASVSGIVPNPDDSYLLGATARRFRTGVKAAVQGNFYARIKLSDGTVAPYTATEGGGATATASLQVIADSWNNYNGSPALEPVLSTAAARNGSVLKANPAAATNTSTNAADYLGFYQVQLTDAAKDAPEGTAITFKVCPKNHFNSDGTPDPAWTVSVTTQVYKD